MQNGQKMIVKCDMAFRHDFKITKISLQMHNLIKLAYVNTISIITSAFKATLVGDYMPIGTTCRLLTYAGQQTTIGMRKVKTALAARHTRQLRPSVI